LGSGLGSTAFGCSDSAAALRPKASLDQIDHRKPAAQAIGARIPDPLLCLLRRWSHP
jgi:hypothetical protein